MQNLLYGYRQLYCSCRKFLNIDRLLSKGKNKNVIGLMKDDLDGQIMKEFVGLRTKTCSYLKDNNDDDKKAKGRKKCIIKKNLNLKIINTA